MTYYDNIYEQAVDEYYLITTAEAKEQGVPAIELVKLASRGRLTRIGQGLYRLTRFIPNENDPYAIAVKRIGKDAYLYGESVIALLKLAPTNPNRIFIASPSRVRKQLPVDLKLIKTSNEESKTYYEGIACQPVSEAIKSCQTTMMPERLFEATRNAHNLGYLTESEYRTLLKEIKYAEK